MEELNLQLKQIRKMRRMSQGDLAEAVGVSSRVISAWERQETEITIKHAKKICEVLDCTFEELIGEKPSPEQLENSKQLDDLFNKLKDVDAVITELQKRIQGLILKEHAFQFSGNTGQKLSPIYKSLKEL